MAKNLSDYSDPLANPRGTKAPVDAQSEMLTELRRLRQLEEQRAAKGKFSVGRVIALVFIILIGGPVVFLIFGPIGLLVLAVLIIIAMITG